jgi:hypothetical protein
MVGYMSLEEQVDADFSRARRRAFLRRISARLRKGPIPNCLLCFEEVRRKLGVAGGVRRGRRTVRLTDIVGSVSRCSEFDGAFLPLREGARTKWERIDRAFIRGEELPPVSLYKIGSSYFVLDGHHRVSVARFQGVEFTDAEMTEFRASLPEDREDEGRPIHYPSSRAGESPSSGERDHLRRVGRAVRELPGLRTPLTARPQPLLAHRFRPAPARRGGDPPGPRPHVLLR